MTTKDHLVLFGPTAVGKTDILNRLSSESIEIISADSMQVYRGMDVGTAKPSTLERKEVPHHLIDCRDPDQQFHLGDFVTACDELVGTIVHRRRLPVISGGTAFYLRGYLYGLPGTPQTPESIRDQLKDRLEDEGLPSIYRELLDVDPVSAEVIDRNDTYRILRALEVYYTTGKPRSAFRVPDRPRADVHARVIGLYRDREDLYDRINRRVDTMFDRGLPDEVMRLLAQGYQWDAPGMRAIGYREFGDEGVPPWSSDQLARVRQTIKRDTRRYAKRQLTFFRSLPDVTWVHADDVDQIGELVAPLIKGS